MFELIRRASSFFPRSGVGTGCKPVSRATCDSWDRSLSKRDEAHYDVGLASAGLRFRGRPSVDPAFCALATWK
jgi:hypothetical protein